MSKGKDITLTLSIDFHMLHKQKARLIERLKGPADLLWGFIHMLDDIQDEAEKQELWKFPEDKPKKAKAKSSKKPTKKAVVKKKTKPKKKTTVKKKKA